MNSALLWIPLLIFIVYTFYCLLIGGFCFTCRMMDLMREISLLCLLPFGLKSQSLAILSHSVPGSIGSVSATSSFSALLRIQRIIDNTKNYHVHISYNTISAKPHITQFFVRYYRGEEVIEQRPLNLLLGLVSTALLSLYMIVLSPNSACFKWYCVKEQTERINNVLTCLLCIQSKKITTNSFHQTNFGLSN